MSDDSPQLPKGFAAGSYVAGYRLEEQIGRGGMAVVFRAHDERLGRQVALKILAPALAADVAFRQRFIRESRAAAAVDDPHIIPVFEAGDAGGVLFIAMRLVLREDVRALLRQCGPLPLRRVAEIVSQVASALDAAHARGLVHRDVKPGNMLLGVTESGSRPDHVYLADFGLSKGSLDVSGLTGTGHFLGTLDYISPEQITGRPVDGRADQYALACTAFELLTGEPPFARNDAMAIIYAQLSEPPPPVTSRRPGLPAELDGVFARALAKPAADRFASCRDFAEALRAAVAPLPHDLHSPAMPPPEGPLTEAPRPAAVPPLNAPQTEAPRPAAAGLPATSRRSRPSGNGTQTWSGRGSRSGSEALPENATAGGPRRRWLAAIAAGLVVVVAAAGGVAALTLLRHPTHPHRASGPGPGKQAHPHNSGGSGNAPPIAPLAVPPCGTAIGAGHSFVVPPAGTLTVSAPPYGAIVTPDLTYTFVALPAAIEVFRNVGGIPVGPPVQAIPVPDHPHAQAITTDGKYLVTATDHGATIIRVSAAEHPGHGTAIAGRLASGLRGNPGGDDLALSADDRFAFIAMRYADKIAVFNLAKARLSGFGASDVVGYVPVGIKPHGMAVSPDGKWLYVTSRFARPGSLQGRISVLSVRTAEVKPAGSIVGSAAAGCGAFRVITSPPDGTVLWVIAQSSNYLLGFNAEKLRTDPGRALIAKVAIGATPLDETLVNGGTRILITDNAGSDVAVVNPAAALAGRKNALIGYVRTTALPRFFAFEPDGPVVLLVTGGSSQQVRAIRVDNLP